MNTDAIKNIISEAGELMLEGVRQKEITKKGDSDFVTDSDLAVQNFIKGRLFELYPKIDFLAEEGVEHAVGDRPTWVLDPIDGTMNFIRDLSLSAISLALVEGGQTTLGIVYNPFLGEMFCAELGRGATLNGKKIAVSEVSDLSGALVAIGTSPYYKPTVGACFDIYRELFLRGVDIRRLGSAALDICYVAAGRFEYYYEYILSIWDYAAARLILSEAGGRITNALGEPTSAERKSPIVASNGHLHEEMLSLICAKAKN